MRRGPARNGAAAVAAATAAAAAAAGAATGAVAAAGATNPARNVVSLSVAWRAGTLHFSPRSIPHERRLHPTLFDYSPVTVHQPEPPDRVEVLLAAKHLFGLGLRPAPDGRP